MNSLLTLILAITNLAFNGEQTSADAPRIRGSVTDASMVGISAAKLEFISSDKSIVGRTASDGTFSLSVPRGVYVLKITADGFCTYSREIGTTDADWRPTLNIALLSCSGCPNEIIDFVEPPIEPDVPPPAPLGSNKLVFKYQEEDLEGSKHAGLKPSVLFGRRNDLGAVAEYTGLDCRGSQKLPVLRYNGGLLQAAKLSVLRALHIVKGEGQVIVSDRQGVRRGSTVEIDLSVFAPVPVVSK